MQRLIEQEKMMVVLFYQLHLYLHFLTVHALGIKPTTVSSSCSTNLCTHLDCDYCLSNMNLVVNWIVKSECCVQECCCIQKDLNLIGITATLKTSAERSELHLIKDNKVILMLLQKARALQLY